MRRRLIVGAAMSLTAVLLLAGAWLFDDEPAADRSEAADADSKPPSGSAVTLAIPSNGARLAPALAAEPSSALPTPATATRAVPVAVTAPQKLFVGDMNDLVVALGPNQGIREIGFTVQFDPNVLQVRAGTEGDWAASAGAVARFVSDISSGEDRVQIHSELPGASVAGGSVAIIQFQGVAPGTTSVLISDVVAKDSLGRWVAAAVSASTLQITVDSPPPPPLPPQPQTVGQNRLIVTEPPADSAQLGD